MNALRLAALAAVLVAATAAQAQTAQPNAGGQRPQGGTQGNPSNVPQPRQEKIFDLGAQWVAVSLNGKPFTGDRPSFSIDKQFRARGFGGCNTFAATGFPLREQRLAVSPLTWTKKTCAPAIMASEMAFFQAFRYAAQWEQQGSTLILRTPSGELRFERAI